VSGDPGAIQDAIDSARSRDTLIVAADTYDGPISLRGKDITVTSTNPDDPNVVAATIIDCLGSGRGFIFNSGEDANTLVDGLTVIGGLVTGEGGAGIFVDTNSSPTIRNVVIRSCAAEANDADPNNIIPGNGGGIYVNADSSPTFINCTVIDCNAGKGGGVFCDVNSSPTFIHCTFSENSAGLGGGMFCAHDVLITITDSNFAGNYADHGAGMFLDPNCSGTIAETILAGNDANEDGGGAYVTDVNGVSFVDCNIAYNSALRGGGLYLYSVDYSTVAVIGCIIQHNRAPVDTFDPNDPNDPNAGIVGLGGGIYCWGTPALIRDCVIIYNSANTSGAGIYLTGGAVSPQVINCLIVNNLAGRDGGGISANWYVEPLIANCTFVGNAVPGAFGELGNTGFGGGLYCGYNSDCTVTDSIFWNNYALEGLEIAVGTGFEYGEPWPSTLTVSYSDLKGGRTAVKVDDGCALNWGPGNINAAPLFVTGPLGDYYLSQTDAGQPQNSPCVDTGSSDASFVGLTGHTTRTDEVFDKGTVDMGYHYPLSEKAEPCRLCDLVYDGFIDFHDFAMFALSWLDEDCSDANDWCKGTDFTFDTFVNTEDLAFFVDCWLTEDINPPIPSPSKWAIEPYSVSITPPYGISMAAEPTYDPWGWDVQYYFECVTSLSEPSFASG
jgi:parallel beta-helix repeat protein